MTSAETLAGCEDVDEGKISVKSLEEVLATEVKLFTVVDYKGLFSTLPTCRSDRDRYICEDLISIRFEFATKNVPSMIQVPGKINSAYLGTNTDSQLTQTLQVSILSGYLPLDFAKAKIQSSGLSRR